MLSETEKIVSLGLQDYINTMEQDNIGLSGYMRRAAFLIYKSNPHICVASVQSFIAVIIDRTISRFFICAAL